MSSRPPVSASNVVPFVGKQSFGKLSDQRSGEVVDLHRFRVAFNDRWMALLRARFDSPVQVACYFGVTERAAQKWWDGIGGPRGAQVALALMTLDGAADHLLRVA